MKNIDEFLKECRVNGNEKIDTNDDSFWKLKDLLEHYKEQFSLNGVVKSLNNDLQIGDDVLYVGKHLGRIDKDRNVVLKDGTLIASLDTQPHKFRKVL
jgi:hypothetical protein